MDEVRSYADNTPVEYEVINKHRAEIIALLDVLYKGHIIQSVPGILAAVKDRLIGTVKSQIWVQNVRNQVVNKGDKGIS